MALDRLPGVHCSPSEVIAVGEAAGTVYVQRLVPRWEAAGSAAA